MPIAKRRGRRRNSSNNPPDPAQPRLEVSGLRKRYGAQQALAGLTFTVRAGEILGLLGPNGAGKTTTIESVAGLVTPDAGAMRLDGAPLDRKARGRIGLALQTMALQDTITPSEALRLFASLYDMRPDETALLARFGLTDQADRRYGQLSGGQKQRVALALAFVNHPALILLDEPTAGLDLAARHDLHGLIRQLAADGRAVLLATHDMAEAERLCDRLLLIDGGHAVAQGRPADFIGAAGLSVMIAGCADRPLDAARMPPLDGLAVAGAAFHCRAQEANHAATQILAAIAAQGARIETLRIGEATLEDVILSLTATEGPTP